MSYSVAPKTPGSSLSPVDQSNSIENTVRQWPTTLKVIAFIGSFIIAIPFLPIIFPMYAVEKLVKHITTSKPIALHEPVFKNFQGPGFPNPTGNICFLNASLQALFVRADIKDILQKELKQGSGERFTDFKQRKKLQKFIIHLYQEVYTSSPNPEKIEKLIMQIARSPVFKGMQITQIQCDAHEFSTKLAEALEMHSNTSSSLNYFTKTTSQLGAGTTNTITPVSCLELKTDLDQISMQQLVDDFLKPEIVSTSANQQRSSIVKALTHSSIEEFKGISLQLPRFKQTYNNDGSSHIAKSTCKISGIFDPIYVDVEAAGLPRRIKLTPQATVCHLEETIDRGHYVTIVKQGEGYILKSDSTIDAMNSKKDVDRLDKLARQSGYIVHYSVELIEDEYFDAEEQLYFDAVESLENEVTPLVEPSVKYECSLSNWMELTP
ncbi:MAG: ubiquitin carboxyl-terminal hydrolase family protein [Chlamydiota bacterium]